MTSIITLTTDFGTIDHCQAGSGGRGLALINSDDFLELSVFSGSARDKFKLKVGDPVVVTEC